MGSCTAPYSTYNGVKMLRRIVWKRCYATHKKLDTFKEIQKIDFASPTWSLEDLHLKKRRAASRDPIMTHEKVIELAKLSHISIHSDQLPEVSTRIESVLRCMQTVQESNVDGYTTKEVASHDFAVTPLRDDVVTERTKIDSILRNAESTPYFRVPKVFED
uniref:Uncharacterized protein AlNc14C100G6006 n=1 Tax=Albugo laibachii Nc14 TaxID=890382 RepID=F0WHE3_9STRA|nr:conserved hypothetical protein [Albugo laibachii Nc14]|eukprot:CCA20662.1 conserved hypothetical protein [Albugo laibachii Nc14]